MRRAGFCAMIGLTTFQALKIASWHAQASVVSMRQRTSSSLQVAPDDFMPGPGRMASISLTRSAGRLGAQIAIRAELLAPSQRYLRDSICGIIVFAAPPQAFDEAKGVIEDRDEAKGVIEDRGIVRQRYAAEIAILAIESPDIEKIPRHSHTPSRPLMWDSHGAAARVAGLRVNLSQPPSAPRPQGRTELCYPLTRS